ncbi:hypothetical protein K3148_03130 [Qipengyuania aurantiaca]|uniref:Uncharacterized protein n=1 Tax=Qipengyuania aurantiaca TaxID=2867233 RepID=A0ABX8ZN13_9SPHN|nr:hypothetical protein [Qipengyuania aurantiaca]QZD90401.1 hypothetical protein K3148_03130 [Qipengyuania aurantiaca]
MPSRVAARFAPVLLLFAPLLAILAARLATHSQIAASHPRTAALLFLWIAADALALALIAKAPRNRPGLRALLGAIAAGCIVATLAAAQPVREALLSMPAVVTAMALTVGAYQGWSLWLAALAFRRTRSFEAAAAEVLPAPLVRFAAHESAMMRLALFSWGASPQVPEGATAFAYHRVINPMIAAFLILQLIEIVVVDLLVSHWSERAAWVLLALGIWGALFLIALMKAFRLYPVLLDDRNLRVRAGSVIDMSVPLDAIAAIEPSVTHHEAKGREVLNAAILSHPNVILRLGRPLEYRPIFGKPRLVERVAFRLDQPAPLLEALESRI